MIAGTVVDDGVAAAAAGAGSADAAAVLDADMAAVDADLAAPAAGVDATGFWLVFRTGEDACAPSCCPWAESRPPVVFVLDGVSAGVWPCLAGLHC